MPPLLTPHEVRAALRLSQAGFKRLMARGGLRCVRLNARVIRFRQDDLAAFVKQHTCNAR